MTRSHELSDLRAANDHAAKRRRAQARTDRLVVKMLERTRQRRARKLASEQRLRERREQWKLVSAGFGNGWLG